METTPLKVLVADDNAVIRELVRKFLRNEGYAVCIAADGREAIDVAAASRPDVILLDRNMPGLGNLEVMRELKRLSAGRWVPLIMVSADTSQESQVEALENGADDYITKPINFKILAAKIRVFLHHVALQNLLADQRTELQVHRARSEQELTMTSYLMQRLMRADKLNDELVHHWVAPAENFSGDLVAAARSQSGELYGLLADATGHGLSAAVNLIPLTQTFYAMVRKGFRLSSIAEQINQQLRQYTPPDRFVAVTLVQVSPRDARVEVFNAGNPPVLLVGAGGEILREFRSKSVPLGIIDGDKLVFDTERAQYSDACQVVLYSDGLTEACAADGIAFGNEQLRATLVADSGAGNLAALQRAVRNHTGGKPPHDDISVLIFDCRSEEIAAEAGVNPFAVATSGSMWQVEFTLSEQQLRHIDLIPILVDWSRLMGLPPPQSGVFFAVMTELYANALDHGLLGLRSAMKEEPDGYELYMNERQRRLTALNSGRISIALEHEHSVAGNCLKIRVKDNGPGFDAEQWLRGGEMTTEKLSGRGIALVRKLCHRLEYIGHGNEVIAEIVY